MKHWIWQVHGYVAPADLSYICSVLAASEANKDDIIFDGGSTMSTMKSGTSLFHYLQDLDTWSKPSSPTIKLGRFDFKRIDLGHGCNEGIV